MLLGTTIGTNVYSASVASPTINADSPYSMENMKWLVENPNAADYLAGGRMVKLTAAIAAGNGDYLRAVYPDVLNDYLHMQKIDLNFAMRADRLMGNFKDQMEQTGGNMENIREQRKNRIEKEEKVVAKQIIEQTKNI